MATYNFLLCGKRTCVWIWTTRLAAIFGRDIHCEFNYKVYPQCKVAVPVRQKRCKCYDQSKRKAECNLWEKAMKRRRAIESDSVKSVRKAKDNFHKVRERTSETCERILHRQEQNNVQGKLCWCRLHDVKCTALCKYQAKCLAVRIDSRTDSYVGMNWYGKCMPYQLESKHKHHYTIVHETVINSSQHTSTITCTAALRVWHFSAFHWFWFTSYTIFGLAVQILYAWARNRKLYFEESVAAQMLFQCSIYLLVSIDRKI